MFGRRFTKKGWLQLGALAVAVVALLLVIVAPLATVRVRVNLPARSPHPSPPPPAESLRIAAIYAVELAVFCLVLGVIALLAWLLLRTARRIIRAQPKSDP